MVRTINILVMVLRLFVVVMLILGIIIWVRNLDTTNPLVMGHETLGILTVLDLWAVGILQARTPAGNWGLAIGAIVLGLVVALVGIFQVNLLPDPSVHWIIQIVHLLLGLSIIGLGEVMGGRVRRQARGVEVQAR